MQAGLKSRDSALKEVVVTDVCPYSLGVGVARRLPGGGIEDGLFAPIIERGTVIPASREHRFSTMHNNQTVVEFGIYQGEARLVRDPGWVCEAFKNLQYIVIDEFHAFIGTGRGQQLLSLLTRLEHLVDRQHRPIPRVALSATLGELKKIPAYLRPDNRFPCEITDQPLLIRSNITGFEHITVIIKKFLVRDVFCACVTVCRAV